MVLSTSRPTGTVTFLFTDIEGSTRRWEAEPDVTRVALAAHDDVLRAAIDARGGWLLKKAERSKSSGANSWNWRKLRTRAATAALQFPRRSCV